MFPAASESDTTSKAGKKDPVNLSVKLLGNRIHNDQTLPEYLIEFLLIFCSPKEKNVNSPEHNGAMRFHTPDEVAQGLLYYVNTRVGLRRFIFYGRSKQDSRSDMDTFAYEELKKRLEDACENSPDDVLLMHDLLQSYAVVTRNRGWYAQALLPVVPQFIIPDLQGIRKRQHMTFPGVPAGELPEDLLHMRELDSTFDLSKHNFLARGGQILYLHLLEPMIRDPRLDQAYRPKLEYYLCHMLEGTGNGIQLVADFVQEIWSEATTEKYHSPFNMGHITDGYAIRGERFLKEITGFLSNDIHPITRIELLAQGMVLSLMRVIQIVAHHTLHPDAPEPLWIMDMSGQGGTSNIGRMAARSYADAYDVFQSAMIRLCDELDIPQQERMKLLSEGRRQSADIFKKLAKDIRLVIPPHGANERFSLSEQLVRYLVLALVAPHTKITLDTFLQRLYDHFRMVIAPAQYRQAMQEKAWDGGENMADYFEINARAFQAFLRQCGFLRELSDATAIVENPYEEVTYDAADDRIHLLSNHREN